MQPLVPLSVIPGLQWPAIPPSRASRVLSLQAQLEESQWWSGDRLRQHQFEQLGVLIEHARRTVPFYQDRLRVLDGAGSSLADPELWARIPRLERSDLQQAGTSLHSTQLPASHGSSHEISTSGSTGAPIRSLGTELLDVFWLAFTLRDHLWHQRDLSKKLAVIRHSKDAKAQYPHGAQFDRWGPAAASIFATGPAAALSVTSTIDQQARWLQRQNPSHLVTYPSNLLYLAQHSARNGIQLPNLRDVSTIAEMLAPEVRVACAEAWGCRVNDLYSTQEAGYIALQCPESDNYHIQSENVLVEVLDENHRHCIPGQIGRVVVTALHNFAMPLIRYEQGDYAQAGANCPCGRGLPVLNRIFGRARNMFVSPDGEHFWPTFGSRRFTDIAPITQYQFVQTTRSHIEARLVTERELTDKQESRLREHILSRLPYTYEITFSYHQEISRSAEGKFEDSICRI